MTMSSERAWMRTPFVIAVILAILVALALTDSMRG